jgi:hypothetical protein
MKLTDWLRIGRRISMESIMDGCWKLNRGEILAGCFIVLLVLGVLLGRRMGLGGFVGVDD